jgi:hypothetical protein
MLSEGQFQGNIRLLSLVLLLSTPRRLSDATTPMGLGMSRRSGQPSETCTGRNIENANAAFAWTHLHYLSCNGICKMVCALSTEQAITRSGIEYWKHDMISMESPLAGVRHLFSSVLDKH